MNITQFPKHHTKADDEVERLIQHIETPAPSPIEDRIATLWRQAHETGEMEGYVDGARDGRLAGFCWGSILATLICVAAYSGGVLP